MLLLDGCGTCAPLRELSNLVSTGRAARIQILSVWQSLGQLQGGTGERPRRPCWRWRARVCADRRWSGPTGV